MFANDFFEEVLLGVNFKHFILEKYAWDLSLEESVSVCRSVIPILYDATKRKEHLGDGREGLGAKLMGLNEVLSAVRRDGSEESHQDLYTLLQRIRSMAKLSGNNLEMRNRASRWVFRLICVQ